MEAKERRIFLLLQGTIALYEEVAPEILSVLKSDLAESFDLIGSALLWMNQEIKKP